jgi:hypothetical protein
MAQRAHKGRVRGAQHRVRSLASIQVPLFCPRAGTDRGMLDTAQSPAQLVRTATGQCRTTLSSSISLSRRAASRKNIFVSGQGHDARKRTWKATACAWCAAARVVRGVLAHEAVAESISARLNPTLRSRWRAPRRHATACGRIPRPVRCAAGDRRRPAPSSRRYRGAVAPGRGATPERKRSPRETP